MVTPYPIADMLIRIKNGYQSHKNEVLVPWSKAKEAVVNLILRENYLKEVSVLTNGQRRDLVLKLQYDKKVAAITDVKIISKPSLRVYVKKNKIERVLNGLGVAIISTPVGLLTDKEARKKGLGGEVICQIW